MVTLFQLDYIHRTMLLIWWLVSRLKITLKRMLAYWPSASMLMESLSVYNFHYVCSFSTQVRVPLTNDYSKISQKLQMLEPKGSMRFIIGIRIAHVSVTWLVIRTTCILKGFTLNIIIKNYNYIHIRLLIVINFFAMFFSIACIETSS